MNSNHQAMAHVDGDEEKPNPPWLLYQALSDHRRELVFWLLNTAYWTIFGLIALLMTRAFQAGMPDVHLTILMRVACGFVMTAGLRVIYRHARFRQQRLAVKWVLVLGSFLALGLLEMALFHGLLGAGVLLPGGVAAGSVKLLVVRMFNFGLWSSFYFAFHLFENQHALEMRTTRAELAAREHELRHLQAQMNPHFVFSALDGILACRQDPHAVEELASSLAAHLRFLLRDARKMEPLACEVEALEKFLTTQASHLRNRLICRIYMDSQASKVPLPPMTIQPLLEDAFRHRPKSPKSPLHIWLTAKVEDGKLNATLSYSGDESGEPAAPTGEFHALKQRLNLLLGPRASVERHHDGGWTRTSVIIRLDATA